MNLTLEEAVSATHATLRHGDRAPRELRIVTDTRALRAGDVFLALRGERFDGHDFLEEAARKGAGAFVVDRFGVRSGTTPALLVEDTRRAYMQLAAAARARFHGRVFAITGSAGKTTTKHLLGLLLSAHFGRSRVLVTPANENNEIGVSKLMLAIEPDHEIVVVEMGARHAGEIAELVAVAEPHAGILTNIGEAHLEIFGSRERLAQTKWGLFDRGAQAVLNAQDAASQALAPALAAPPLWFGESSPSKPGVWVRDRSTLLLTAGAPQTYAIDVPFPGAHNRANLAAALAAAVLAGMPPARAAAEVRNLRLPEGRYQSVLVDGGPRMIYDAYNASASGTIATLTTFASERARRRIAVLGSMAELGADAPALHERVGAHAAASNLDVLLVGGDYAASIASGACGAGFDRDRIVTFEDNGDVVRWLREHARPDDVVLLKASRKYRMEEIVQALSGSAV